MEPVGYRQVEVTGGFWGEMQRLNAEVSVYNIHKRFSETGRFSALKCQKSENKPHIFYDSDVAKWLESAAYILAKKEDAHLRALAEEAIEDICRSQQPCGYFNSYFQVCEPENIFQKRTEHELYCAGHLIEAAVALKEAGVDEKLYAAMCRYADYIYDRFYVKKDAAFTTCGHPEIELALLRLYEFSGEKKYLDLAMFFLNERGVREEEHYDWATRRYDQTHLPVREQKEAVGHAVRALYLYIAMADAARISHDPALAEACGALFADITGKKMYVTGGVGSTYHGEAFTFAYDLPNTFAYSETCAAIALALFCGRLSRLQNKAEYHAVFERVLYNGLLSGESRDGKGFFYVNPLEFHEGIYDYNESLAQKLYCPLPERVEVFDCSCCPPNITRFIESIGGQIYAAEGDTVYVNQYISSRTRIGGAEIEVESGMPYRGTARVCVNGRIGLRLRVPAWKGGVSMRVNGRRVQPKIEADYIELFCDGDIAVELDFKMAPYFVYANENVFADAGRKAVAYGPLVLCGESCDNGKNLRAVRVRSLSGAKAAEGEFFTLEVPAERLKTSPGLYSSAPPATEKFTLKLIPYFLWANRGKGDMQVWWL